MGYVTAPLQVAGQIAQSDAKAGEHHHGNGEHGSKESSVDHIAPGANNQSKTLAHKHNKQTDHKEHPEAHPLHGLIAPQINDDREQECTDKLENR